MSAVITRIALLRGVMPTGKNKVLMAELREVLAEAGFGNVRTWIQSGNALVDTDLEARATADTIRTLIRERIGPDLAIIVMDAEQLRTTLREPPFTDAAPERIFYTLTMDEPAPAAVTQLLATDFGENHLAQGPYGFYLHVPNSMARSKLNNNFIEKKLGISATTRNRNTLAKLIELAEA